MAICEKCNRLNFTVLYGSSGGGQQRGGNGVIREIELLTAAQVTLLADLRH